MNNLPFVTKAAQIQAPHPPILTKITFKGASEAEPLLTNPAMLRGGMLCLPAHLAGAQPLHLANLSSSSPSRVLAVGSFWLCLHNSQQVSNSMV